MTDKELVYMIDEDCKPDRFLEVVETMEERENAMEKWWTAFHNGEKMKPENYNGISHAPIANFEEWVEPE